MRRAVDYQGHVVYGQGEKPPFVSIGPRGQGRFGTVDEVEGTLGPFKQQRFARKCIVLRGNARDREATYAMIKEETDILKYIRHSHNVRLIATYLQEDRRRTTYGIVMDPIADHDLEQYFEYAAEEENRDQVTGWFGCLINGLAYLHGQGIRHRDIKPHNILIHNERIFFTDFGISTRSMEKTMSSTIVGGPRSRTMQYCAPEVELGHTRARSADIFSLAAVFLEMLVVYCDPDDLLPFRESLEFEGQLSYATHHKEALEWAEEAVKGNGLERCPQLSSIVFFCHKMMDQKPKKRPQVECLQACWRYRPFSRVPDTTCKCDMGSSAAGDHMEGIDEALHKAAENGDTTAAELLIEQGAAVNTQIEGKGTALHAAAAWGRNDMILLLVDHHARINVTDGSGATPLHRAAANGKKDTIRLLLDKGADVNAQDKAGNTPLFEASRIGNEGCFDLLVEEGGKMKLVPHSRTPVKERKGRPNRVKTRVSCKHKAIIPCQLASTRSCCSCVDQRPISNHYEFYMDGRGLTTTTDRSLYYCPSCKDYLRGGGKHKVLNLGIAEH